ncbi:hypothetical protein [Winogradskyella sp.]|uniref:hypothetical protein n=1 Tax=Winogradskyella sp. TaxID=1883156 RepID=UPI003BAC555E
MKIINGIPCCPYFIFLKGISRKTDIEILSLFNFEIRSEVNLNNEFHGTENHIYMSRDDNWIHIMDNFFYSLWYSEAVSQRIEHLAETYEIFTCSVGDVDLSFDFNYYKNGKKVREYVVESPNYVDEILKKNVGNPLKGEYEGLKLSDQLESVIYIAKELGIKIPKKENEITCYEIQQKP